MFLTFKKWTALYVLLLAALFAGFALILWQGSAVNASKNLSLAQSEPFVLVIDPGHGGMDGGAVAEDGTTEAEINLALGLELEDLARFLGLDTEMTRREDVSIHDPAASTVRAQKASDLKNRTALVNAIPGALLVSIHQNSLPQARGVHGAQAFYNGGAGAEALAQAVQEALNAAINDRPKEPRAAGDGVYLMAHTEAPAVLVECGFLSNAQETALLKAPAHRTRLAVTILAGVLQGRSAPPEDPGKNS